MPHHNTPTQSDTKADALHPDLPLPAARIAVQTALAAAGIAAGEIR